MIYEYTYLQEFIRKVFLAIGCPVADAYLASKVLISADLRGVDSHGTARLSGYIRLFDNGRLNPNPQIKIIHETPSTAVIDGDKGLGLVVDMIGWAMTNAAPLVTPTFSKEKLLGTNPIAVAVPAEKNPPFVADFASTAVAYGKMEILQRKGSPAPLGWVQDKDGNATDDSNAVKNGGALLPLGGDREHGSHKGYGLGAIVDIFSGVLSGANFGPWVPPFATAGFMNAGEQVGKGTGHFLGAMRIDGFRPAADFKADMDRWIDRFHAAPAIDGKKVLVPGDPEREIEAERKANGINLLEPVMNDLKTLADRFGIEFVTA
jgi:L-2-hydroxycarboxylate dehydrogenase (NAD+)